MVPKKLLGREMKLFGELSQKHLSRYKEHIKVLMCLNTLYPYAKLV
jgi:hypothetical protein